MDASRKPLAKVEGRRLMPLSGLTIACRGAPSLDLLEEVPRHVVGRQAKLAAQDAGETVLVLEAEDPAFHLVSAGISDMDPCSGQDCRAPRLTSSVGRPPSARSGRMPRQSLEAPRSIAQ